MILETIGKARSKCFTSTSIVREPQITTNDVFQKTAAGFFLLEERNNRSSLNIEQALCSNLLQNHSSQNHGHVGESIERLTNVVQAAIVGEDLLQDKCGDRFREFAARLHDAQRQGDDLCGQEEIDHFGFVGFHQGADHAERRQTEIFERSR